jgi:hypothetical protein
MARRLARKMISHLNSLQKRGNNILGKFADRKSAIVKLYG